jgi:hypothetical protein
LRELRGETREDPFISTLLLIDDENGAGGSDERDDSADDDEDDDEAIELISFSDKSRSGDRRVLTSVQFSFRAKARC